MPKNETVHKVPHRAEDMFALVARVEDYPKFVPLCEKLIVRSRVPQEQGGLALLADMTVAYKFLRETFTSRVVLDPERLTITTDYVDGPFRHLENRWHFVPAGEGGCEVHFFLDYEFRSRALGALMGTMFDRVFRKFADAFEARADVVYGRG